jgi:hypothetical protein
MPSRESTSFQRLPAITFRINLAVFQSNMNSSYFNGYFLASFQLSSLQFGGQKINLVFNVTAKRHQKDCFEQLEEGTMNDPIY